MNRNDRNRTLFLVSAWTCLATLSASPRAAQSSESVHGLGYLPPGDVVEASRAFLMAHPDAARATAADDFVALTDHADQGRNHVRFQVSRNGLKVYHAHAIVQSDEKTGAVRAVTSSLATSYNSPSEPEVVATKALAQAFAEAGFKEVTPKAAAELCYLLATRSGLSEEPVPAPVLAWRQAVEGESADHSGLLAVYADALTGRLLSIEPLSLHAKNRSTYDGLSLNEFGDLPGLLRRAEGQGPVGDACIDAAHEFAGRTYDFYLARFGRDSWDGRGGEMVSTVDWRDACNAYWVLDLAPGLAQVAYGRGGLCATPLGVPLVVPCLALDPDVVAHEWGHGLISSEAGLTGNVLALAVNEALCDVFAAVQDVWFRGGVALETWIVAELAFHAGDPAQGLRYLDDPARDGVSFDHYPDVLAAFNFQQGVGPHQAGGVVRLAFFLLSQGGVHPRGVTDTVVAGVGVDHATTIFYRGLLDYLLPLAGPPELRAATLAAAADRFGQDSFEREQVRLAWEAVGVLPPNNCQDQRPCGVVARGTGAHQAVVQWTDPVPDESGFRLRYAAADGGAWTTVSTAADVTVLELAGLATDTEYRFQVRTLFPDGSKSAFSDEVLARTLDGAATSGGPSNLVVSATPEATARLIWSDNSNAETGFRIRRERLGPPPLEPATPIANVPADATVFEDVEAVEGATYAYQVRALFGAGQPSPYTAPVVLALPGSVPGGAPERLTLSATSDDSVYVGWIDRTDNETGFELQRRAKDDLGGSWTSIPRPAVPGVGKVDNYHDLIDGAAPGQGFDYRLRALLPEGGATPFTPTLSVFTFDTGGLPGNEETVCKFAPSRDGYVAENYPQDNFGDLSDLLIHTTGGLGRHAYVAFDVSLPPGTAVQSAHLDFSVLSTQSFDSLGVWFCHDNDWAEATLSWLNQPWDEVHLIEILATIPGDVRLSVDVTDEVTGAGSYTFGLATSTAQVQCLSSREGLAPPILRMVCADEGGM
ncbi:MAG: M4 family metallopeptidase [Planctomycetota bacterium]